MRSVYSLFYLLILLFFLSSCATYSSKYAKEKYKPKSTSQSVKPDAKLSYTLMLIGDTGLADANALTPSLKCLEYEAKNLLSPGDAVCLGDNIYPSGMPKKDHPDRTKAELALASVIDVCKPYDVNAYFVPGNHDWEFGLDGVKRQERFIKRHSGSEDLFLPKNGCGDPEAIEVNDHVVLIFIDSEWYLQNWDNEPEINAPCETKNRNEFFLELDDLINKYSEKTIVISMHHPLYTYGPHGGRYKVGDHLFPFRAASKAASVPLPIIGSLFMWMRHNIGIPQDVYYKPFNTFRERILKITNNYSNVIFAAGHEHNLQYIEKENTPFIVSGSGSKLNPVALGEGSLFAAAKSGMAKLSFYDDGSVYIDFMTWNDRENKPEILFSHQVFEQKIHRHDHDEEEARAPSTTASIYDKDYTRGGLYRFFWGDLYRKLYARPMALQTLYLDEVKDGLVPVRKGGGFQTKSLRLLAPDDKNYVLRGLKKDGSRLFGGQFRSTFIEHLLADLFTATYPYSPVIIPQMAESIGVLHTRPQIVYVPEQKPLGEYNHTFSNNIYLFEERPAGDWSDTDIFASSDEIISSAKLFKRVHKSSKHKVDQQQLLVSRLFDMIIGDWDRHEDQWRWARIKLDDGTSKYLPIPRDRDQAFSHYDGFFIGFAKYVVPLVKQMQPYKTKINNIQWLNHNGKHLDRRYLNELSWEQWRSAIDHIQKNLTDEIILKAFDELEQEISTEGKGRIAPVIQARRDQLLETGKKYYRYLSRDVDVPGTRKDDIFSIDYQNNGDVRVRIFRTTSYPDGSPYYDRYFKSDETNVVNIYGLDGKDQFLINGNAKNAVKVRIIGGQDDDMVDDASTISGGGKKIRVYDGINGINISSSRDEVKDLTSTTRKMNIYDHHEHLYNTFTLLPVFTSESGNGFIFGLSGGGVRHGFKKEPYASSHRFNILYGFQNQSVSAGYSGEYVFRNDDWRAGWGAEIHRPRQVQNFFGDGNTLSDLDQDLSFYRVSENGVNLFAELKRVYRQGSSFIFRGGYQNIEIERDQDRFVSSAFGETDDIFDNVGYASLSAAFHFHNIPNVIWPSHGFQFNTTLGFRAKVNDTDFNTPYLQTYMEVFQKPFRTDKITMRVYLEYLNNFSDFEFYHAASLGGGSSIRGLYEGRLRGQSRLFQQTDLRIQLAETRTKILPIKVGLSAGFDAGRVWLDGEDSSSWHTSFGGGLSFTTIDAIQLEAGWYKSQEDGRLLIGFKVAL